MAYQIDYGPQGTTLIQVGDKFYLAYQDADTIYYWEVDASELTALTDAPTITYDNFGVVTTPIKGFQNYTPEEWSRIKSENNLWFAGQVQDVGNNKFVIENVISGIKDVIANEPWSEDTRFLNLVTEAMIEDPNNWQQNLELDPENRFMNLINEYGYSKSMFNRMRTYGRDDIAKGQMEAEAHNLVLSILDTLEATLDEDTTAWAARQYAMGKWSQTYLTQQLTAATQKHSIYETDASFQNVLDNGVIGFSNKGEDEIRNLLDTWLPKSLHEPYLNQLSSLAGQFINNPDFALNFEEKLKDERFAFNSNWDREIPWSNIMGNAKTLVEKLWGVVPNEDDAIFGSILLTNDINKQSELIRLEGLNRGYAGPTADLVTALTQGFGTEVVPMQDFRLNTGGK